MNITELIAQLEALRAIHGDLPVYVNQYDRNECSEATMEKESYGQPDRVMIT